MHTFEFHYKGARFVAEEEGRGPAVIFLHGFLESRNMWKTLWPQLPKTIRKISLDLPGHGDSENLGYIHSMEEMAEVVMALVHRLSLRKVFLVGHSMGGYVALAFAERYPDNIRGMVLMNSNSRADSDEKRRNRDRAVALVKQDPQAYIRTAVPLLFSEDNRKSLRKEVNAAKKDALRTSAQGVVAALEGMKIRADREAILAFAPYPILFVASRKDPALDFEMLQEQLEHQAVQGLILEEGHMSHFEEPEKLIPAFKHFLKEPLKKPLLQ
tara:strand:+ start:1764 stop:2573 length:810 start_codon:yes stop_codon:yes gene_type:complete